MNAKELEQFYTPKNTAEFCIKNIKKFINKDTIIIEPSAGKGVFVELLKDYKVECFDIEPKCNCKKVNFLEFFKRYPKNAIVIGNPPYGKKGKLAIEFINHSLKMVDIVAFIVPKTLAYSYISQKNINGKLIFQIPLPKNEFEFENKIKKIPSYFQIWVNDIEKFSDYKDLKLLPPKTTHTDLEIKIYNKTITAKKWLDWDWDIAIKRNSKKGEFILKPQKATPNTHWILVKAKNKEVLNNLIQIDYSKANDEKMTAGMSRSDIIKLYEKVKNG